MKTPLAIFLFIIATCANAQTKDILYLKNGGVIKGKVIEQSNGTIKIKTSDGNLFSYSASEIDKQINVKQARRDSIETHRKLYVGFTVCPLITIWNFRKVQENPPGDYHQTNVSGGFVGGFVFAYHRKNVGFETGLNYRTYGLSTTNWYSGNLINSKVNEWYHDLEIPFLFNVYSNPGKVRFIGSFGATGDVALLYVSNELGRERLSIFKGSKPGGFLPYYNNYWDCIGVIQAGIEASIVSNILVRVCPMFSYGATQGLMGGLSAEFLFDAKAKKK